MSQDTVLYAAQQELKKMLKVIHEICEKHNIKYWMSDGTLLGAIRHKGFVPWDDDIDLGMMREDYERFRKIIVSNLPERYKVQSIEHHVDGLHNWCKILYLDDFEWYDDEGDKKGLFLDIFPFDYVVHKEKLTLREAIVRRVERIAFPVDNSNFRNKLKRTVHKTNKILGFGRNLNSKTKPGRYVTYGIETCFYREAFFDIDDIFPLVQEEFEGNLYYAPKNSHNYLSQLYGNYMYIPRESERHIHMQGLRFMEKSNFK